MKERTAFHRMAERRSEAAAAPGQPEDHRTFSPRLQVWTDTTGVIRELTEQAAELLNVTPHFCVGRRMDVFMDGDRPRILYLVDVAARGHVERFRGPLRPRERQPRSVSILLEQDAPLVRWTITPERERSAE
jgi:hypothetical protein